MKIEFEKEEIVGHGYKTLADLPVGYGASANNSDAAIYVRSFNAFVWFHKDNGSFGTLVVDPAGVKTDRVFKVEGIELKLQEIK